MPKTIESVEDLKQNLSKVESYLVSESNDDDFEEMCDYIKRGHNLVAYLVGEEYHFAPSRFVGYKNNSLSKHKNNRLQHLVTGTETDKVINQILRKHTVSDDMESKYQKFCKSLHIEPDNRTRKYWCLDNDVMPDLQETFEEGTAKLRTHIHYERNKAARDKCIAINGAVCKICGMDFEKVYGEVGKGYIQVHHIVPISESEGTHNIDPEKDLIPVCANCHCMLHRLYNGKFTTIKELSKRFR
jgi:5-methylcytosine-specific restriction protein A